MSFLASVITSSMVGDVVGDNDIDAEYLPLLARAASFAMCCADRILYASASKSVRISNAVLLILFRP